MLQLRHYSFELPFQYPFSTAHGTKTHQPTLVVSLGLGQMRGYGEAPAITYYDVSVADMVASLESKKAMIERYALTDPQRFWHFLHHLIPGQHFLTAALDIAGWDLFAQLRKQPLYKLLGLRWENIPFTDYTIGLDDAETMLAKLKAHPWPIYKIKCSRPGDIDKIALLRTETTARIRIDANEGWTFEEARHLLPELHKLGVELAEQPLPRDAWEEMKELKAISPIPIYADESCRTEDEVRRCAEAFHGINIKLTKCGGITPALRMIKEARTLGLRVMMGSMNESTIGTAAIAHMLPLLDEAGADGPLLLREDVADGLHYDNGKMTVTDRPGLGIRATGVRPANYFGA
ncbi:dipeptide epimerase [Nemorincola caseinilytica]